MKKPSGLKNDKKVQNILVSGSAVLPQKNSKGIRVARKRKSLPTSPMVKGYPDLSDIPSDNYGNLSEAGSITSNEVDGGIISGKLVRAKYDNTELKKSIDTTIFELIPQRPVQLPDTVLRSVYNVVTQSVNDLTVEVQILTNEVSTLNSEIQELEIVSESLKIVADNEKLRANIAAEQARVANVQVGETTIDLSNAIQNSINEAIQRVSLTARNEALLQENDSLREQLFGLAAQAAEGASSGTNNLFTAKVIGGEEDATVDMKGTSSHWGRRPEDEFGVSIEVNNVTTDNIITNIQFSVTGGPAWLKVRAGYPTTIVPESGETYGLKFDNDVIGGMDPRITNSFWNTWSSKATSHKASQLKIEVTFADGSTDSVIFTTHLRKNRKG